MAEIKPIETIYNGYRFRSRLEAKWAVFFDALQIKYEYEPEGYKLSDGTYYLPDFYLPQLNYYVEVKGKNDHMFSDMEKVRNFVLENKSAVIILSNIPYDKKAKGLYWFPIIYYSAKSGGCTMQHYAFFMTGGAGSDWVGKGYIQDDFYVGQRRLFSYTPRKGKEPNDFVYNAIQAITGDILDSDDDVFDIKVTFEDCLYLVDASLLKARQARFEHGETPKFN